MLIVDDCVNICIVVVESYVHAFITDGERFYIHVDDEYFVFNYTG